MLKSEWSPSPNCVASGALPAAPAAAREPRTQSQELIINLKPGATFHQIGIWKKKKKNSLRHLICILYWSLPLFFWNIYIDLQLAIKSSALFPGLLPVYNIFLLHLSILGRKLMILSSWYSTFFWRVLWGLLHSERGRRNSLSKNSSIKDVQCLQRIKLWVMNLWLNQHDCTCWSHVNTACQYIKGIYIFSITLLNLNDLWCKVFTMLHPNRHHIKRT